MAATGTLGARLYITDAAIAASIDTEAEFSAQTWTEVGLIESFGEFGKVFAPVNFQAVADGRMYKLKGGFDNGDIAFVVGQDLSDDGQAILAAAGQDSTQDNFGIKIELNDAPALGGPTTFYLRGLVMSYRTQMGSVNNVIKAASTVAVNSEIIHVNPSDAYDKFLNGGSLAAYHLFNGTDAEAVDPVISGNALVLVSGNDSAGDFATNGSQAITDAGYTLSNGPLVIEAMVKLSAITNVYGYFGVTDQKVSLEAPIESAGSADTIITTATDAVGFMFDTRMATDNIWLVGVNNNVDETAQDSGLAFIANTYDVLRIEIAANGDAVFYINGVAVGSPMTTACRTSVPLYPTLCVSETALASRTETVDYLYVRQD
jgi:hypothetical protein